MLLHQIYMLWEQMYFVSREMQTYVSSVYVWYRRLCGRILKYICGMFGSISNVLLGFWLELLYSKLRMLENYLYIFETIFSHSFMKNDTLKYIFKNTQVFGYIHKFMYIAALMSFINFIKHQYCIFTDSMCVSSMCVW